MSPSHHINFHPTDFKEKKTAILAVISFNDAYSLTYSRGKLSEYFGVNERTAQRWCAEAASTTATQPPQQPETSPALPEGRGTKRHRSEEMTADVPAASSGSSSLKSQKATQKEAQSQKRRKTNVKNETIIPSSHPPQQLLTPPRRNTSKKRKQGGVDDLTSPFQSGDESWDEYTPV